MIDFYALLGVNNNQLNREIKNAYRKLALKYHPDRYQGDINEAEEMMKLLNEAKDVLLNEEKRQEYDNALHSFQQLKTRQQKEAVRRQAREDYDRWQQQEAERHQQEAKRQQQEAKRQQQEAKRRRQKEVERRQSREDYDRWQQETKLKMQQEVKLKDSIIKNFKEKLLQEEKSQLLAEAERLVREAEEQRNQEALERTLKKRNRILLVFTLIVIGLFINISLIYLT